MHLIQRAKEIATLAHSGVKRKVSNDPYIVHPSRVANMIAKSGGTDEMVAVAWLHDVQEDAPEYMSEVKKVMPVSIIIMIDELSKPEGMSKFKWLKSFKNNSRESIIIKMADRFDNLLDAEKMNKEWLDNYLKQTKIILDIATGNSLGEHRIFEKLLNRYNKLKQLV